MLKSTPIDRRKAAWLYQQFIVSKTVSLKKSHVGLTFIRESDIWDKSFTERAPKLGGLIEFYRSPARVQWTPTGNNVPDYPKLAQLWWQNIGDASSGAKTPQAAMDSLAAAQDSVMERLEKSGVQGACGPKLNKKEIGRVLVQQVGQGRQHRAAAQAGEREAEGRNRRLRHPDQVVAGLAAQARVAELKTHRCHRPRRRTIQYAAASRSERGRHGLLDAPLSQGMTGEKRAGSDPGLLLVVIAEGRRDEAIQLLARLWIASLRSQ